MSSRAGYGPSIWGISRVLSKYSTRVCGVTRSDSAVGEDASRVGQPKGKCSDVNRSGCLIPAPTASCSNHDQKLELP